MCSPRASSAAGSPPLLPLSRGAVQTLQITSLYQCKGRRSPGTAVTHRLKPLPLRVGSASHSPQQPPSAAGNASSYTAGEGHTRRCSLNSARSCLKVLDTFRYRCRVCCKTFGARTSTIFHPRRTNEDIMVQVITLVSWGCPISAIEQAYGLQARTVRDWPEAAGQHAEGVHPDWVVQPRDLGQVQADELRVKTQCGIVWMAMAMMVSPRLCPGGVISTRRDQLLITRLVALIAACIDEIRLGIPQFVLSLPMKFPGPGFR